MPHREILTWGVVGAGGMADAFAADLRLLPDARLGAVVARRAEAGEAFARRHGGARAYTHLAAFAADDTIDIVYIATPHAAHHEAADLCLRAGRHVVCEKPLTLDHAGAAELVATARASGRFLMEAMWMLCVPAIRRLCDLVADGAIGEVVTVHADFGMAGPFPPGHRLLDPALGGGALMDVGVYPVALAQRLLGEPAEVTAWARHTDTGVDATTGMVLGHENGAAAVLACSLLADSPRTAAVCGTAGRVELPREFFRPDHLVVHRDGRAPERVDAPYRGQGWVHEAAEAMRCVRAGLPESPLVPHEGTLAVLRTLDAVRERIGVSHPVTAVRGAPPPGGGAAALT